MKKKKLKKILNDNPVYTLKDDKTASKERKQKSKKFFKKNGFYFEECWNLDFTIARFILPRLVHFKKIQHSTPASLSEKEWNEILDKMIKAFALLTDQESLFASRKQQETIEEGLNLFAKYFQSLWD